MPSNEVKTTENIRSSADYQIALDEVKNKDILAIFLDICKDEGTFQYSRRVTSVKTYHEYIDAQDKENIKTVEAKKNNNGYLDMAGVVCMFVSGWKGGQMNPAGALWYSIGQGFEKTSGLKSQSNQGNVSGQEHKYRRYDNLIGEQSQGKQGSEKNSGECRQTAKTALDATQRIWEAAAAA